MWLSSKLNKETEMVLHRKGVTTFSPSEVYGIHAKHAGEI